MRALPLALAAPFLLLATLPSAAAEFGAYDERGYPIALDGTSTFPGGVLPVATMPAGPLNNVGPLTVYPYYGVLTAELQRMASERPDLVKLHSIGKSTLGLDLWMLEIADFARIDAGDAVLPLDEREVVWVDGGTHSNEYSGVWFAAHLASFLVDQYGTNETATWIVENRRTWIMPMVNPDGSHAMGRLNANLVNVNRNYPVDWGALAEDLVLNNPGPAPASESETQANIAWFNKTRPDLYVSVHCCGNLWLYPYGVEGMDPLDQQAFSRICDEAFATVREDCGPIWSTIYPASGSSVDTVYEYTGAAAFGYEMSGRNAVALWGQPITANDVETEEIESWTGVMHGFLNVHRYGAYPAIAAASVQDGALVVTVRNDGYGNLTAASLTLPVGTPPEPGSDVGPSMLVGATREIPALLPGQTATIVFDEPLAAGAWELRFEYVQRTQGAPVAVRDAPLLIESAGGKLRVASVEGGSPLGPAAFGAVVDDARVPLPAAALAILGLALVARLLRRRA